MRSLCLSGVMMLAVVLSPVQPHLFAESEEEPTVQWEAMPDLSRSDDEIMAAWRNAAAELTEKRLAEEKLAEERRASAPQDDHDDVAREQPESSILRWLRRHQSADGSWSAAGHPAACTLDGPKVAPDTAIGAWGVGWPERDVLLTAASLLVYYGAGYDHRTPSRYRRVVLPGIQYLVRRVDEQALPLVHHHTRAMVAFTLAEAYAMTNDPELRGPAERVLAEMTATALTTVDGDATRIVGWAATPGGTVVDLQATLLGAMALKSGQAGGLDVGTHLGDLRLWFIGLLDDSESVLQQAGRSDICLPQRASVSRDRLYGEDSAVALMLAAFLGVGWRDDPRIDVLAARVMDQLDPISASDPFQRYATALGLFQVAGPWWTAFNAVHWESVRPQQISSNDCRDGSWPAHPGLQASIGSSTLTSTIFNSLSLQVYHKFGPNMMRR